VPKIEVCDAPVFPRNKHLFNKLIVDELVLFLETLLILRDHGINHGCEPATELRHSLAAGDAGVSVRDPMHMRSSSSSEFIQIRREREREREVKCPDDKLQDVNDFDSRKMDIYIVGK
jgi:hypothetical protein